MPCTIVASYVAVCIYTGMKSLHGPLRITHTLIVCVCLCVCVCMCVHVFL